MVPSLNNMQGARWQRSFGRLAHRRSPHPVFISIQQQTGWQACKAMGRFICNGSAPIQTNMVNAFLSHAFLEDLRSADRVAWAAR
eukprot:scaffold109730_cov30-Tisochrysis_lutea.AAC.4